MLHKRPRTKIITVLFFIMLFPFFKTENQDMLISIKTAIKYFIYFDAPQKMLYDKYYGVIIR